MFIGILASSYNSISISNVYGFGVETGLGFGLGSGSHPYYTPTSLFSLTGLRWIDSYNTSTFYVLEDGSLYGTGLNSGGQLGIGSTTNSYTFVKVPGSWIKVKLGLSFAIGLQSNGTLWHSGMKSQGVAGDGTTTGSNLTFTQIGTGTDWVDFDVGYQHVVASKQNGSTYAWGTNGNGECGQGNFTSPVSTPTLLNLGSNAVKILASGGITAILKSNGQILSCGSNNSSGHGATKTTLTPLAGSYKDMKAGQFSSLSAVVAISVDDSAVWWGYALQGIPSSLVPTVFDNGNKYKQLMCARTQSGINSVIGIRLDGSLWGQGDYRMNGFGGTGYTTTMSQIGTDTNWVGIAGRYSTLFAWK